MNLDPWKTLTLLIALVSSAATAFGVVHLFATKVKTDLALLNMILPDLRVSLREVSDKLEAANISILHERQGHQTADVERLRAELIDARRHWHWHFGAIVAALLRAGISVPNNAMGDDGKE